jgi:hypothetical protein
MTRLVRGSPRTENLVPACVIAEWWRGGRAQERLLEQVTVVNIDLLISQLAGQALEWLDSMRRRRRAQNARRDPRLHAGVTNDAIVMATASFRCPSEDGSAPLFTGDHDDMARFAMFFPNVRLFAVTGTDK